MDGGKKENNRCLFTKGSKILAPSILLPFNPPEGHLFASPARHHPPRSSVPNASALAVFLGRNILGQKF